MSRKCVKPERPTRMSNENVTSECPTKVLRRSVKQECPTRVSNQRVKPQCSTIVSGRKFDKFCFCVVAYVSAFGFVGFILSFSSFKESVFRFWLLPIREFFIIGSFQLRLLSFNSLACPLISLLVLHSLSFSFISLQVLSSLVPWRVLGFISFLTFL